MKKVILFAAVVSAFSFASCKKDHTCTCTSTSTSTEVTKWDSGNSETANSSDSNTDVIIINKAKKGDAKKACIDNNSTNVNSYDSYGYNDFEGVYEGNTITTTTENKSACSLK